MPRIADRIETRRDRRGDRVRGIVVGVAAFIRRCVDAPGYERSRLDPPLQHGKPLERPRCEFPIADSALLSLEKYDRVAGDAERLQRVAAFGVAHRRCASEAAARKVRTRHGIAGGQFFQDPRGGRILVVLVCEYEERSGAGAVHEPAPEPREGVRGQTLCGRPGIAQTATGVVVAAA